MIRCALLYRNEQERIVYRAANTGTRGQEEASGYRTLEGWLERDDVIDTFMFVGFMSWRWLGQRLLVLSGNQQ